MDVASAEWVIVERPLDDGTAWYLFPIEEAIARLDRAPGASIVDALDLHEWSRSSVASADADPASVSGGDIVLRDGRPIGLIDPRGPTAAIGAAGRRRAGRRRAPACRGTGGPPDDAQLASGRLRHSGSPARAPRGGQRAKPPGPAEPAEDKRSVEADLSGLGQGRRHRVADGEDHEPGRDRGGPRPRQRGEGRRFPRHPHPAAPRLPGRRRLPRQPRGARLGREPRAPVQAEGGGRRQG